VARPPNVRAAAPEPERASEVTIARCRVEVEGRGKARIRRLLVPLLRRCYRLAEVGEGFQWARDGRMRFGHGSRVGRYAYVGSGFEAHGIVVIGDLCLVSAGCKVIGADHVFERVGTPTRLGVPRMPRPITVFGLDCWIGRDAKIMEGVRVGRGAVVGSGALVTRDVPPYTVVGGVPARVLRDRFDADDIARHERAVAAGAGR